MTTTLLVIVAFCVTVLAFGAGVLLLELLRGARSRTFVTRIYEPDLTTTIVVGPEAPSREAAELGALDRFETFCRMSRPRRSTDLSSAQIVTRSVSS